MRASMLSTMSWFLIFSVFQFREKIRVVCHWKIWKELQHFWYKLWKCGHVTCPFRNKHFRQLHYDFWKLFTKVNVSIKFNMRIGNQSQVSVRHKLSFWTCTCLLVWGLFGVNPYTQRNTLHYCIYFITEINFDRYMGWKALLN